jgi:hypothetical protein
MHNTCGQQVLCSDWLAGTAVCHIWHFKLGHPALKSPLALQALLDLHGGVEEEGLA